MRQQRSLTPTLVRTSVSLSKMVLLSRNPRQSTRGLVWGGHWRLREKEDTRVRGSVCVCVCVCVHTGACDLWGDGGVSIAKCTAWDGLFLCTMYMCMIFRHILHVPFLTICHHYVTYFCYPYVIEQHKYIHSLAPLALALTVTPSPNHFTTTQVWWLWCTIPSLTHQPTFNTILHDVRQHHYTM